jgi:exopolyphosphatase/guanosine-5'-triphosphate,3'-diphosphate pyrophosphatase
VRLTEEFLPADPAPAEGLARMRQLIARELRKGTADSAGEGLAGDRHLGHGGGAERGDCGGGGWQSGKAASRTSCRANQKEVRGKTVGKAFQALAVSARLHCAARPGGMVPTREVRKLAAKLAKMTLPERAAVPKGIGPRRAEIIVAGAQVFAELLESFGLAGAFAIRRWGCATAFWRRCWPSRTRAPPRIASSSTSAGRACWPRRGATASIPEAGRAGARARRATFAS